MKKFSKSFNPDILQLYMEDLCKQGIEYGVNLHFLEDIVQGSERGKAKIQRHFLQSRVSKLGIFACLHDIIFQTSL